MTNIYANKKKNVAKYSLKTLKIVFMAFILFLMYFPLLVIGIISIDKDPTATSITGLTLNWYQKLFSNSDLMTAILRNTILVAIISTIISTILGTITAIGINSLSKKNRKRMIMLNNVPILNADIATAILLFIIFQVFGIIFRIQESNRLNYITLVISHVFFSTPYVILSVLPKLGEIDKNLYDAALDLGCKPRHAIIKVIIPAIKTGIMTGAMLAFTMSIDDFVISYFVSGADCRNFSTWFYATRRMSHGHSLQLAAAYNTLLTTITIVSLVVYNIIKIRKTKKEKH